MKYREAESWKLPGEVERGVEREEGCFHGPSFLLLLIGCCLLFVFSVPLLGPEKSAFSIPSQAAFTRARTPKRGGRHGTSKTRIFDYKNNHKK